MIENPPIPCVSPVLIADDDEDDLLFLANALIAAGVDCPIQTFHDGHDLILFLKAYTNKPAPSLIISDMNMPKASGKDVLITVRNNPFYKNTPFLILSTSRDETEIKTCYSLGANSFLTKPSNLAEMEVIAKGIKALWVDGFADNEELSNSA
ncbi:MAG: response regulator [Bacteroidia bacterium]